MIVLHGSNNNYPKLKMFVKNRVDEIKKISYTVCFYHCPINENPAKALSRGKTLTSLKDQDVWWFGHKWLIK